MATNRQTAVNRQLPTGRLTASGRQSVSAGGGGGSDLTNVSALPAPGAADASTIYHLDKDDRCYILNAAATALVPIDLPGWPRRDGSDDEEWETTDASPPTGWTWDNQSTTTSNENGTRKSFLVLTKSSDAAAHSVLYKAVPASPNKTYQACLQWASDIAGSGANCQAGIVARSSAGALLVFVLSANPTPTFFVVRWTNSTSFNVIAYSGTIQPPFIPGTFGVMAMNYDGTNLAFQYAPFYEGGEANLVTIYSEAVATFLGTFNQFGLTILKNSGTTHRLFCDWLRVV